MKIKLLTLLLIIIQLNSCNQKQPKQENLVEFIDLYVMPNDLIHDSTLVGGLSSLDPLKDNRWLFISDDRSEYYPARYYTASILYNEQGIDSVAFEDVDFITKPNGNRYAFNEIDPEAIRYNPFFNSIFITSEGGRSEEINEPFIHQLSLEGHFKDAYPLPDNFMYADTIGIRDNGGLESLSFENDTIFWFANEVSLKEDGQKTQLDSTYSPIRLIRYDLKNNTILAQYSYPLDAVHLNPIGEDPFFINSCPEILVLDSTNILMLERAYADGAGNDIRLYHVKVSEEFKLTSANQAITKNTLHLKKKEIFNFSNLPEKPDNIEGIAFGKKLSESSRSLFFISDNNFNEEQRTQLWLFSVNTDSLSAL